MFSDNRNQRRTHFLIDDHIPHDSCVVEVTGKISDQIAVIIRTVFSLVIIYFYRDAIAMFEQGIQKSPVRVFARMSHDEHLVRLEFYKTQ